MTAMLDHFKQGRDVFEKIDSQLIRKYTTRAFRSDPNPKVKTKDSFYWKTLRSIIDEVSPLPIQSIIVGACEDGMHFYMDLSDPGPGSILIASDRGCGKTRLIKSILTSAVELNHPRQARYIILTDKFEEYNSLSRRSHCYQAVSLIDGDIQSLLKDIIQVVESRYNNQYAGSAIIIAIDDLITFCDLLDDDNFDVIRWLVQNGPLLNIWPIVTLDANDVHNIDIEFLRDFSTRLLGKIDSTEIASSISESKNPKTKDLIPGSQFKVYFDNDWLSFWIPEIGGN
jgi:hypothetical protein